MRFRSAIGPLAVAALLLAACGSDDGAAPSADDTLPPVAQSSPTSIAPPADPGDDPASGPIVDLPVEPTRDYVVPTGADELVISYEETGGFTTARFAFQQPPRTLVSGDGRSFEPGVEAAIFPGPLLPTIQTRTISDLGIQRVVAAADAAGLLADVEYETDVNIADAPTAVLTINVDGETWVHEAYALGLGAGPGASDEVSTDRRALLDFIMLLADLETLAGVDELGEYELFEPEAYEIVAIDVTGNDLDGGDVPSTVTPWPADAGVRLADTDECTVVDNPAVGEVFVTADELTYFTEDGSTYEVLARPVLPGSTC